MQYTAKEKETVCTYDYQSDLWTIYSCVPRHMTKLRKIAEPFWEEKHGKRVTAAKWKLKGNQLRFAREILSKMTPQQKEGVKARLGMAHEKRKDIV